LSESEELSQHDDSSVSVLGLRGEERVDVADVDGGPIMLAAFGVREVGEVSDRRQAEFDGEVAARQRTRSPRACGR
jgi:hypothetical protein